MTPEQIKALPKGAICKSPLRFGGKNHVFLMKDRGGSYNFKVILCSGLFPPSGYSQYDGRVFNLRDEVIVRVKEMHLVNSNRDRARAEKIFTDGLTASETNEQSENNNMFTTSYFSGVAQEVFSRYEDEVLYGRPTLRVNTSDIRPARVARAEFVNDFYQAASGSIFGQPSEVSL